jgi:uncharacterized protein (DUF952 family)
VHLSTPEQVALLANRLFCSRSNLLLLVLDPARIGVEIRWEPGVPGDPESMRYLHAYGPVPVAAVMAVRPTRRTPTASSTPLNRDLDTGPPAWRVRAALP